MFNLKSFVLNRHFLAKPKRVNSLWFFGLSKTLLLICLLVITGGINHRVSAQDITYKQLGADDVIKTDGTKYALQLSYSDNITINRKNYFLANGGYKSNNIPYITLGVSSSSYISDIANIIKDLEGAGKPYLFTFEKQSGGTIVVKNYNDDTYWGFPSTSIYRPSPVEEANAKAFTCEYNTTRSAFIIKFDGQNLNVESVYSAFLNAAPTKYRSNTGYYRIYEIIEPKADQVNYKYYDAAGTALNETAYSVAITTGGTVENLANLPNYVDATFYTNEGLTAEVPDVTATPAAGTTYYVKTRYKSGMPFVLGGTYFALGNGSNYLYNHDKTSGNDQYAIKMSGDWYDGFVVQDYSDNYLSDAAGTFGGTADSKLQIELTDAGYFLKSVSTGNYIRLSADAVAYVADIASATSLSNLSETKAGEILAAYPAARYVGTYSSTQTGVAFDDIVKGNGKIAREASKYYFVEQAANTDYLLSSVNSSQELTAGTTVYAVSGSNGGDNFAALWSFYNNVLTNINANKGLSPQAELGAGTTATVGASSVSYSNPQNIQSYTISLAGTGVYNYLKQSGNETIEASAAAPGAEGYWYLREAETFTIKMNAVGGQSYATVYAPVALAKPAGETAKLYTAAFSTDKKSLVLTEITSEVIAKETPIVLISKSAAASAKLALSYAAGEAQVSDMEGCILKQLFDADANRKDYRTLGRNGQGEVGFFVPSASVTNIPANRAYLNIPEGSTLSDLTNNLVLRFEDGTETGIAPSELFGTQEQQSAVIFDLSGRRVQQAAKGGIYIMNGKKIYVK